MNTIYKYPLKITDEQYLELPGSASFLTAQFQDDQLCVWVELGASKETRQVKVKIRGTGHELGPDMFGFGYLATAQGRGGLVWHVFVPENMR